MDPALQLLAPAPATAPAAAAGGKSPRHNRDVSTRETEPSRFADSLADAKGSTRIERMNQSDSEPRPVIDESAERQADASDSTERPQPGELADRPGPSDAVAADDQAVVSDVDPAEFDQQATLITGDPMTGLFEVTLQLDVQPLTQGQLQSADPELIQAIAAFINRQQGGASPLNAGQVGQADPPLQPMNSALQLTPVDPATAANQDVVMTPTQQAAAQSDAATGRAMAQAQSVEANAPAEPAATPAGSSTFTLPNAASPANAVLDGTTDTTARTTPAPTSAHPSSAAFGPPTNDEVNTARITRGLNTAVQQQGGGITLRLTPPELGTVRIQLQVQGTSVNAQFHAETEAGRSLLQQQLGQLRSTLEAQGLSVERLGVQAMANSSSSSQLQQDTQQHNSGQPQSQAGNNEGRSRGQYQQPQQQPDQSAQDPGQADQPRGFDSLLEPDADADAAAAAA